MEVELNKCLIINDILNIKTPMIFFQNTSPINVYFALIVKFYFQFITHHSPIIIDN